MELKNLSLKERQDLALKLLQEQVVDQRKKLHFWKKITNQAAQIDTGYIGQHLVSLISGVPGRGMRGKGDDLADGSEVKSANFLDSMDMRGAVAPRWNFASNNAEAMEGYLKVPKLYLVSLDVNPKEEIRARIWELDPRTHEAFRTRYEEWMQVKGYPKLSDSDRPGVNFQLFPPRNRTNETFARHGNGRVNGFEPLKIHLENVPGSRLIFHAEEKEGVMVLLK